LSVFRVSYKTGLQAAEELKKIFSQNYIALYALKWVLSNGYISCVVPGASRVAQAKSNSKASDILPHLDKQMERDKAVSEKYIKEHMHHL